jgi:hypothetical protein
MEELSSTKIEMPLWLNQTMQAQAHRIQALIDMNYLINNTWLYVFSLIYPLFGIIFGLILYQGSISSCGKKIGRTCLILGVINLALALIFVAIFVIIGGIFSRYIPNSL